jgi:SIR2-like domain
MAAVRDSALDIVARAIGKDQCLLFLGAGVHAPPPAGSLFEYPDAARPPVGSQLSRSLANELDLLGRHPGEDVKNLQRVALFFQIERDRHDLVDAVKRAVHDGKRPSPMLKALAEMNFSIVITTNYDELFERALYAAGKSPKTCIYSKERRVTDDPRGATPQEPIIYKIHGDIKDPKSIVITDEDYIDFVLRMSDKEPFDPVPLGLKFHLTGCTTLFVGYSLLDYNLRLLFKTLRWRLDPSTAPQMYSVDLMPDPLIRSMYDEQHRYLRFIVQNVWAAIPALYRLVMGKEFEP